MTRRREYVDSPSDGTEEVIQRPWAYATLVLACPDCEVDPGERCRYDDGRARSSFHFGRYELARALVGRPLKPRVSRSRPVAADVGGEC